MQRLGAEIDEDDLYDSFDHILNPRSDHILAMSYCVIFSPLYVEGCVCLEKMFRGQRVGRSPRAPRVSSTVT